MKVAVLGGNTSVTDNLQHFQRALFTYCWHAGPLYHVELNVHARYKLCYAIKQLLHCFK